MVSETSPRMMESIGFRTLARIERAMPGIMILRFRRVVKLRKALKGAGGSPSLFVMVDTSWTLSADEPGLLD